MSRRPLRSPRTSPLILLAAALALIAASCSDGSSKNPHRTTPCDAPPPGAIWSSIGERQAGADYGRSVTSAGDVNADGYGDLLVTASGFVTPAHSLGKAYLYLGGPSGPSTTPAWTSTGDVTVGAQFGFDADGAGDVNGDGYDDVIVGAYHLTASASEVGKAYVYLGDAGGLAASPIWTSMGDEARYAHFGASVASAGDVNDDGFDDIVVGAEHYTTAQPGSQGKAYLYLGGPGGPQTSPAWTSSGADVSPAEFGRAVASAGDVNGDGFDDVLIGAPGTKLGAYLGCGQAFLYLGEAGGLSITAAWTATGEEEYDAEYGRSVSSAGDVNGDGLADFIVGEPRFNEGGFRTGKVYVYHGSTGAISTTPDWTSVGDGATGALFGFGVASAGDVNADGHDDIVVGAEWFGPWPDRPGKVYVFLGGPGGLGGTPAWTTLGDNQFECWFGGAVSGVGDVDGDGRPEVGIGAWYFDCDGEVTGKAYVYSVYP